MITLRQLNTTKRHSNTTIEDASESSEWYRGNT